MIKINGEFICKLTARTEDSPALLNRTLHIYATKRFLKFYLFNSSTIGWYRKCNIIYTYKTNFHTNKEKVLLDTIASIMNNFNLEFSGKFKFEDKTYNYDKGTLRIEVTNGYRIINKDNSIRYIGDFGSNGNFYKDLKAWEQNNGVIYIGEYAFEALEDNCITTEDLWERKDWVKYVKEYIIDNYKGEDEFDEIIECNEFIEHLAYDVLYNADWQDLTTLLQDFDYNCDWIYDNWEVWKLEH